MSDTALLAREWPSRPDAEAMILAAQCGGNCGTQTRALIQRIRELEAVKFREHAAMVKADIESAVCDLFTTGDGSPVDLLVAVQTERNDTFPKAGRDKTEVIAMLCHHLGVAE